MEKQTSKLFASITSALLAVTMVFSNLGSGISVSAAATPPVDQGMVYTLPDGSQKEFIPLSSMGQDIFYTGVPSDNIGSLSEIPLNETGIGEDYLKVSESIIESYEKSQKTDMDKAVTQGAIWQLNNAGISFNDPLISSEISNKITSASSESHKDIAISEVSVNKGEEAVIEDASELLSSYFIESISSPIASYEISGNALKIKGNEAGEAILTLKEKEASFSLKAYKSISGETLLSGGLGNRTHEIKVSVKENSGAETEKPSVGIMAAEDVGRVRIIAREKGEPVHLIDGVVFSIQNKEGYALPNPADGGQTFLQQIEFMTGVYNNTSNEFFSYDRGASILNKLPLGTYILNVVQNQGNYIGPAEPIVVEINSEGTTDVFVDFINSEKPIPPHGDVFIKTIDANTKDIVPWVMLRIYNEQGEELKINGPEVITTANKGVEGEYLQLNDSVYKTNIKNHPLLNELPFIYTSYDGETYNLKLKPGKYTVKESVDYQTYPILYNKNLNSYSFEVNANADTDVIIELTPKETQDRTITVKKIDSITRRPLDGSVFGLFIKDKEVLHPGIDGGLVPESHGVGAVISDSADESTIASVFKNIVYFNGRINGIPVSDDYVIGESQLGPVMYSLYMPPWIWNTRDVAYFSKVHPYIEDPDNLSAPFSNYNRYGTSYISTPVPYYNKMEDILTNKEPTGLLEVGEYFMDAFFLYNNGAEYEEALLGTNDVLTYLLIGSGVHYPYSENGALHPYAVEREGYVKPDDLHNIGINEPRSGNYEMLFDAMTGENGETVFTNVPNTGEFKVMELMPPSGYKITKTEFDVDWTDPMHGVVTIENERIEPYTAGISATLKDASGNLLKGVELNLTDSENNIIRTLTTDDNGKVSFTELYAGDFKITQTAAVNGYLKMEDVSVAGLKDDETREVSLTLTAAPAGEGGKIRIKTVDAATGEAIPWVFYRIFDEKGEEVTYDFISGKWHPSYVSSKQTYGIVYGTGNFEQPEWQSLTPEQRAKQWSFYTENYPFIFGGPDGIAEIILKPGKYTVMESKDFQMYPINYFIDETIYNADVAANGTVDITSQLTERNNQNRSVTITKKDSITGDSINGAVFGLFIKDKEVVNPLMEGGLPFAHFYKDNEATNNYRPWYIAMYRDYSYPQTEDYVLSNAIYGNNTYFKAEWDRFEYAHNNGQLPPDNFPFVIPEWVKDKYDYVKPYFTPSDSYLYEQYERLPISLLLNVAYGQLYINKPIPYYVNESDAILKQNPEGYLTPGEYFDRAHYNIQLDKDGNRLEETANHDHGYTTDILIREVYGAGSYDYLAGKDLRDNLHPYSSIQHGFINEEELQAVLPKPAGNYEMMFTAVADENGKVVFNNVPDEGEFKIMELLPPPGYKLDETEHDVDFVNPMVITNERITPYEGTITVTVKNPDGENISGVELAVKNKDGMVVGTVTTDENGKAVFTGIATGDYTIVQTNQISGYQILNDIPVTGLQDKEERNVDATLIPSTDPLPGIFEDFEIRKIDSETKLPLPGSTLTITNAAGTVVETFVSGDSHHLIDLEEGTYTLTETKAPEGYDIAAPVTFTVTEGGVRFVEMLGVKSVPVTTETSTESTVTTGTSTVPVTTETTTTPVTTETTSTSTSTVPVTTETTSVTTEETTTEETTVTTEETTVITEEPTTETTVTTEETTEEPVVTEEPTTEATTEEPTTEETTVTTEATTEETTASTEETSTESSTQPSTEESTSTTEATTESSTSGNASTIPVVTEEETTVTTEEMTMAEQSSSTTPKPAPPVTTFPEPINNPAPNTQAPVQNVPQQNAPAAQNNAPSQYNPEKGTVNTGDTFQPSNYIPLVSIALTALAGAGIIVSRRKKDEK